MIKGVEHLFINIKTRRVLILLLHFNRRVKPHYVLVRLAFVPKYLGLPHIERNKVIEDHTTEFARVVFADSQKDVAIAVADGTYVYIEKSGDYSFQRRLYSVNKGRPLLKPMMLVATDGYILTVLGPYLVKTQMPR